MVEEYYANQFEPWVPNHVISETNMAISADFMGGAMQYQERTGDAGNALVTAHLIRAALLTNFYLDNLSMKPKEGTDA